LQPECGLPVPEACELVRQAALGLQAGHDRGLVHRDVKPSNLMLARGTPAPRVVVIDWGLVKFASESGHAGPTPDDLRTRSGVSMGTPDYISPEQVADTRSADIRTDIYSLGATLYRLLAGSTPFQGRSDIEKLLAHQREAFPPLERARPDTPAALLGVIQKMVEKDPARRFATPGEVAAVLQPFACGPDSPALAALFGPAPVETRTAFQNPTVMGVNSPMPAQPAYPAPAPAYYTPPSQPAPATTKSRRGLLIGAAVVLLLAVGIPLAIKMGGKKESDGSTSKGGESSSGGGSKSGGSQPINVDFSEEVKTGDLPRGWKGDAFRVIKDPASGDPCLQVSSAAGDHFVTLPVALAGDFTIEAVYFLDGGQYFNLRLDASKSNSATGIGIDHSGKVTIDDDPRSVPPNFKPFKPVTLRVTREGSMFRVSLNGEVAFKNLPKVLEYDSIQIHMPGGQGWQFRRWASLYRFKVTTGQ
jgi:hypothetical protein